MTIPDFHLGDKAKATIGTTRIKGLNALTVPGLDRSTIKVEEFGRDFDFTIPTSAAWTAGSVAGNYVRGDTTGQRALREKLFDNEGLPNLRLYENADDFWAPDIANDANSVFYVKNITGPDISKSGLIPFSAELLVQGLIALFDAHVAGDTLAFANGGTSADTVTDSGNGFVTGGFKVGMSIIIDGSTSNDDVTEALITGVAADTLTLSTAGVLTSEAGLAGTVIHGGKL